MATRASRGPFGVAPHALVPAFDGDWSAVPALALLRAEDGGVPHQPTLVRVAHDARGLSVRFDCDDRDIWSTHVERDAPLWEEEVVEMFIAPGDLDPAVYLEIEVNPLGTIFDARVTNPEGRRDSMRVDASWHAQGLQAQASRPLVGAWRVEATVAWSDLCEGMPPRSWRANFYRIDRPRDGRPEFSAWSPTLARPADFHKPACFGRLALVGAEAAWLRP